MVDPVAVMSLAVVVDCSDPKGPRSPNALSFCWPVQRRKTDLTGQNLPSVVGEKFDVLNLQMLRRLALKEGFAVMTNKFTRDHFFLTRTCLFAAHLGPAPAGRFLTTLLPTMVHSFCVLAKN